MKPIEQTTFWLGYTESLETLRAFDWELNDVLDLLYLLIQTASHFVCAVWHFHNHQERHEGSELLIDPYWCESPNEAQPIRGQNFHLAAVVAGTTLAC